MLILDQSNSVEQHFAMAYRLNTTRLLLAHDSQDDAEQLINALRKTDRISRAQLVLNEDELVTALKSGNWDLFLCRPQFASCSYTDALDHLKRLGKSPRVLIISDEFSDQTLQTALEAGAHGIVPRGDDVLLTLLIDQQLAIIKLRKDLQRNNITLHDAERRLQVLMAQSRDAIAYVVDGMHISANDTYASLFGYHSADELTGIPLMDLVVADDQEQLKNALKQHQKDPSNDQTLTCRGHSLKGNEFSVNFIFSASIFDDEECTQIVIHQSNSLDESTLQKIAQTDALTGLPNRNGFMAQLDQALSLAVNQGKDAAVFYLRIDDFAQHQSRLGIENADELLKHLVEELTTDTVDATLARIGNDEFALIEPIADPDEAAQRGEALRQLIEQQMPEIGARTVAVTASIGVAFVRENSRSSEAVLTKALECCNKATLRSKGKGNTVLVHNPIDDYDAGSPEAITLVIKQAIKQQSFQLQYQYIMTVADTTANFFEVFVKLPQADGSVLTPSQFMPYASEAGLTAQIDRIVAHSAMTQLLQSGASARLLINLNGASLQDKSFTDWLINTIESVGLAPERLVFQLNEGDASSYLKQAGLFASALNTIGCQFSISRFGGIPSPFKLLEHIPAQILKLEGSYTREMDNEDQREKMNQLATTAHQQGQQVMVSFVESPSQMLPLWQMPGVCYMQGYYLGQPKDSLATALAQVNTND